MTATLDRPDPVLELRRDGEVPEEEPESEDLFLSEVLLALVTVTAAVGLMRLFDDAAALGPVLIATAGSHVLAAVVRRRGVPLVLAGPLHLVAGAFALSWTVYPHLLHNGILPGSDVWSALGDDLRVAWDAFGFVKAPTDALAGFVVASFVTLWLFALLSDVGAFRVGTSVEAVVPASTVFVFTSMLGDDEHRVIATAVFVAAVMSFMLVERSRRNPLRSRSPEMSRRFGFALIAASLLLAAVIGPRIPGTEAEALFDWKAIDGSSGTTFATNPIVDIRGRIVNQSARVAFTVSSDVPAYWRTASLDEFDGELWGISRTTFEDARGELPVSSPDTSATRVTQTIEIEALRDQWLPAAFLPVSVDGPGTWGFDPISASLFNEGRTRGGDEFTIVSAIPNHTKADLRATSGGAGPLFDRYKVLPEDFSLDVRLKAEEVTQGALTDYDKAKALQDYFRGFTYDIEVAKGHGNTRVEEFLSERRGYCEQFAGTFAAMARHLGLAARVAVGFTPGEWDESREVYVVRGEHYHAWPEVWFDRAGWVAFEPTPGRGSQVTEPYTDVPAQQSTINDGRLDRSVDPGALGLSEPSIPDFLLEGDFGGGDAEAAAAGSEDGFPTWATRTLIAMAVAANLAVLWAVAVPALRSWRSRNRRRSVRSPAEAVDVAWSELIEALALSGVSPAPAETRSEFVQRAARTANLPSGDITMLAEARDATGFGDPSAVAPDVGQAAMDLVSEVEQYLAERGTNGARFRRRLDPRPLLGRWQRR